MAAASSTLETSLDLCLSQSEGDFPSVLGEVVRAGLTRHPKSLPPWLFYDEAGSLLFDRITELPEYYLTRIERGIFQAYAPEMIEAAADGQRLRIVELGAGSADKTRLILAAAADRQPELCYCPVDVSDTALEAAQDRLARELPQVQVEPLVEDYTRSLNLGPSVDGERRLVLFIGSSIGNFLPEEALQLLSRLRAALAPGDSLLLGVDLAPNMVSGQASAPNGKSETRLIAAYDDAEGVTAGFNKNLLVRLNRELGADFDLESFEHRIRWNRRQSRIEMHLESIRAQTVRLARLGIEVAFAEGETIHTENSYKYAPGEAERLLRASGLTPAQCWNDPDAWFAVHLATVL